MQVVANYKSSNEALAGYLIASAIIIVIVIHLHHFIVQIQISL